MNFETIEISAAGTSTLVTANLTAGQSQGRLGYVTVLKASAQAVTIYDGDASTGTAIATIPASLAAGTYWFLRPVTKGLTVVAAASFAGDFVIGYNRGLTS